MGNLDARRDWGFAGDYVEAMWRMLQQPEGGDYVVSTGRDPLDPRPARRPPSPRVGIDDWERYVEQDPRFFRPAEVDLLIGDAVAGPRGPRAGSRRSTSPSLVDDDGRVRPARALGRRALADAARARHRGHRPGRLVPQPSSCSGRGHEVFGLVTAGRCQRRCPPGVVAAARRPARRRVALRAAARAQRSRTRSTTWPPSRRSRSPWSDPVLVADVNGVGVLRLLDALRDADARDGGGVPASCRPVAPRSSAPPPAPQNEQTPLAPRDALRRGQGVRPSRRRRVPSRPGMRRGYGDPLQPRVAAAPGALRHSQDHHAVARIARGVARTRRCSAISTRAATGASPAIHAAR